MAINRVLLTGNLTRDPELRSTASGYPVMSFSIAVNERKKNNQTGEWEDAPVFVDCVMFGNRAQGIHPNLSKGMKLSIDGKLRQNTWEKNGERRSKLEVIVDELEFMSQKQQPRPQTGRQGDAQYAQATYYETPQQGGFFGDDCPF